MGNLLAMRDSFLWEDNLINRNLFIDNLNSVIETAREYGDEIYSTPNFSENNGWWADFITFLYETQYDSQQRINRYPWMGQLQHSTLIYLFNLLTCCSPDNSINVEELRIEFPFSNNEYIACYNDNLPLGTVYDEVSWNEFHNKFVSKFSLKERRENYDYFNRFYRAELTMPLNQIRQSINNGRCHNSIIRIDNASTKHEKIHVHFSQHALNIDGTWHHNNNNFTILEEACVDLTNWGFKLPEEYYH
jgi:hypothetical protein